MVDDATTPAPGGLPADAEAPGPDSPRAADDSFDSRARELFHSMLAWLERQPLRKLAPEAEAEAFLRDRLTAERLARYEEPLRRAWGRVAARARAEERTPEELLGPSATEALRKVSDRLEPSEALVRSVLQEGAYEEMMATVLYDALREFVRRADLLGPFIDRIPVLGGLRRRVMAGLKEEFDRRMDRQVRDFLTSASKAAVEKAIQFAIAPQNREKFRRTRRRLLDRVLTKPVKDQAPDEATSASHADEAWKRMEALPDERERLQERRKALYERFGDRTIAGELEAIGAPDERAEIARVLARVWGQFVAEDEAGRQWYRDNPLPPPA